MPASPLSEDEVLGGLVFAKVRPATCASPGWLATPGQHLKADLSSMSNLAWKDSLAESLIDWRLCIEQLAKDFLAGRAEVDPRDYPNTCERCGLQTLCRIQEKSRALLEDEDENGEGEER
jgi:ATP-dependent helicase/nuclease subunit B